MGRQQIRLEREKLYREGREWPVHMRGYGGINAGGVDRYSDPWVARYALNFTNRVGLYGSQIGALATRPGYAQADNYGLSGYSGDAPTSFVVRALHKWHPSATISSSGEMCRIISNQFQVNDGTGWAQKNVSNLFNNTTCYPEILELGWPTKTLLMAIPGTVPSPGGLYVYDGTDFWKQDVPRYSGGMVSSLRWICQGSDGRAYACGDYIDADMPLVVNYSAPATVGVSANPTDVTQWTYPNGGLFLVYAQGPRNISGPTRITGMAWLNGYVVIYTEVGRYIISNPGSGNESIDYLPGYGCLNGKLVTEDPYTGRLFWWDAYGGYSWTGAGLPDRLSAPIWPLLGNVALKNGSDNYIAQKYFSFMYLGQWFTCLRTSGLTGISTSSTPDALGHDLNTNFVFDMITRQWYCFNMPMTDATVAQSGIDLGQLYFASPVDYNLGGAAQFKTFRYGYDEVAQGAVFSDDDENILSIWQTPKLTGGDLMRKKQYEKLRLHAEVSAGATPIGASISVAVNSGTPFAVTWPPDPSTVIVHDHGLSQTYGNYIEFDFRVESKRRTIVYATEYSYVPVMTDG